MQPFLSKVIQEVLKEHQSLLETTFVLPNKRSGIFLKKLLKVELEKEGVFPRILSIEEFICELAEISIPDQLTLVFEFYGIYQKHTLKNHTDSFENFCKWAPILLKDFNDLDSNLFNASDIFSYLHDSKRIELWDLDSDEPGGLVQNYLNFYQNIEKYYIQFTKYLKSKGFGYQGMAYRIATDNIDHYSAQHQDEKFVFAGFNALNKAEEKIIQELLIHGQAKIYWDHDKFYGQTGHQAGQQFNKYKNSWSYFNHQPFLWEEDNINSKKTIHLYGLPKSVSQIKQIGIIIDQLHLTSELENSAVVLGNEKLLQPLLNSIPEHIESANITMGFDLQNIGVSKSFLHLFYLHLNQNKWGQKEVFYYKDLKAVLFDPFLKQLWNSQTFEQKVNQLIYRDNSIFISKKEILALLNNDNELRSIFEFILSDWSGNVKTTIQGIISMVENLKSVHQNNALNQEYLLRFKNIFTQLLNLVEKFDYINNLSTLFEIFVQILKTDKLSFRGEPLEGLQIMGLLESRCLDFDTLIISSVNEGFLPAQNRSQSFIPNDIKLEKKIPTQFDRDAIFSYHFFRLFHRAKNIHLVYNNLTDDFGSGEPSRFIKQLEVAKALKNLDKVQIQRHVIAPRLSSDPLSLKIIPKNESIVKQLVQVAKEGFSPTSLSNYIRNPIEFYKKSILKLGDPPQIEEIVAANTFGTIIHESLDAMYRPYLQTLLSVDHLTGMGQLVNREVEKQFIIHYSRKSFKSGRNYLAFEIAKQFIKNFLSLERKEIEKGKKIEIISLEQPVNYTHYLSELNLSVKLKGKIDRIDKVDGVTRIVDYKTGRVDKQHLKPKDWRLLTTDDKYAKAFQVLCYALMYMNVADRDSTVFESGIYSFKNLKSGFIKFNDDQINKETLDEFVTCLDELLLEIFNKNKAFEEKELPIYQY